MSNKTRAKVSYLAIMTDSIDEAQSLASYLNDHGVVAFQQAENEVNCPLDGVNVARIDELTANWNVFYEHSDTGVLGAMSLFEVPGP